MEKSCVAQALEHLHELSELELQEEWRKIESLDLPKVDADEFVDSSMRHFDKELLVGKKGRNSFLQKIACL